MRRGEENDTVDVYNDRDPDRCLCADGVMKMSDLVSREEVIKSITAEYNRRRTGDGLRLAWIEKAINAVPSVRPDKQVRILAEALDYCPLTYPCDTMCEPEGWCQEHCKPQQDAPDMECWIRYSEVMANE